MIKNFIQKKDLLQSYINDYNVDGILLFSPINREWFLDFKSSYGWLFVLKNKIIYIVDSRYYLEVTKIFKNDPIEVWCLTNNLDLLLKKVKNEFKINNLLIESDYITLTTLDVICKTWNFQELIAFNSTSIREVKFENELDLLQQSADIIVNVFNWLVKGQIKPGISEIELAKLISIKILEFGASGNSFDPIVAANLNGANPHHQPTDYVLQPGDMITIDMGCVFNGYTSDMTRTVVLGDRCNNEKLIDIYNTVLEANKLGIKNATNNISGFELDLLVRNYIDNTEYKGLFSHGLGHGVGLQVHELPNANASNKNKFQNNNVITIEPGIYFANVGGVRIEDTIVIKDTNPIVLTKNAPKELLFIKINN